VIKALLSQIADRESVLQQIEGDSDFPSGILNVAQDYTSTAPLQTPDNVDSSPGAMRGGSAHAVLSEYLSYRFLIEDRIENPSAGWISRLRLSARVHTYVTALSYTLISRWELFTLGYTIRSLIVIQPPPNHKLVTWECRCGEIMSTYIHENRAGAATEMAKRLT
jgi:hypothetical protein